LECRFCKNKLEHVFVDLGMAPPSNSFITKDKLLEKEIYYPLKVFICDKCFLVQIDELKEHKDIFNKDYIYFSSFSKTWLEHCRKYSEDIIKKLKLNKKSYVIEIASNDGYMLKYFQQKKIPNLGIEPAKKCAEIARKKKLDIIDDFLSLKLSKKIIIKKRKADLLICNNVLAHIPDINEFTSSLKILLKEDGTITAEFPHLLNLIKKNQFDTIYHEHYSYYSFFSINKIFKKHKLIIYNVEKIQTHGGSLRIYIKHKENKKININASVKDIEREEFENNLDELQGYSKFSDEIVDIKNNLLKLLIKLRNKNKIVIGYGAAAKGNTFLNFAGIKNDLLKFVVDISPYKQSMFLPGSRIPIYSESKILKEKPDYILILAWNLRDEIIEQLKYIQKWDGKFIVSIPKVEIL